MDKNKNKQTKLISVQFIRFFKLPILPNKLNQVCQLISIYYDAWMKMAIKDQEEDYFISSNWTWKYFCKWEGMSVILKKLA